MSCLEALEAQVLLEDATVRPSAIRDCGERLTAFLSRFLPLFYCKQQREHVPVVVRGLLGDLQRKTCLPIAIEQGIDEKPLQYFVGLGRWNDEAVLSELRAHVKEELGAPGAALILDPSGFAKKGVASCGVKRQWCGRLGKVENCQVGVFLAYASERGQTLIDRRLYLPEDWAADPVRRTKCHVPEQLTFQTKVEIGACMLQAQRLLLPHGWILGDDEFGRCAVFRKQLRDWDERYLLDVPCNALIRDLERSRPRRRRAGRGRKREVPFIRAAVWLQRQPASRWQKVKVRDGEKGPLEVHAMSVRVNAKAEGRVGPEERLLVTRTVEEHPQISFALTNAGPHVPLEELVRAKCQRQRVEQAFEAAKGEVGLAHYEVRSWTGWHHHMTLALLSLWFVTLEKLRVGKKNSCPDRATDAAHALAVAS